MHVAVLGPLEVRTDGHAAVPAPVAVAGERERLLLALLAARSPRPVGVEELADVLWGERPPDDAPGSVRDVVRGLRAALEPGLPGNLSGRYVLRRGPGFALELPRGEIDAGRFVALAERARDRLAAGDAREAVRLGVAAVGLWRGEPYADWPDVPSFDDERRRLQAARTLAEATLAEARSRPAVVPAAVLRVAPGAVPRPLPPPVRPAADLGPPRADAFVPVPASPARPRRLLLPALLVVGALVATALVVRSRQPEVRPPVATDVVTVREEAERLAELSATEGPLDVSLLLAAQAYRLDASSRTRDALRAVLLGHPRAQRIGRIPGTPRVAVLAGAGPTLLLATETDLVGWPVATDPQPRVLRPIPQDWGSWTTAIPSPTDAAFVAVGRRGEVPWVRMVSGPDGESRLIGVGDLAGGRPVDGVVSADGRRIVLLVVDPVEGAPELTTRWRVVEVDAGTAAVRDTGVTGAVPYPMGTVAADFTLDGGSLVVWDRVGDDPATLVDLADGRQVTVVAPGDTIGTLRYRALPGGGAVRLGRLGELVVIGPDGAVRQVLEQHRGPVLDAAVSPDGAWAITAGDAVPVGELYRWSVDPATGRWSSPEALRGHRGAVLDVEVDVTGTRLLSVSGDGTAISWDMRVESGGARASLPAAGADLFAVACAIAGRDLTPAEWTRYLPTRPPAETCTDLAPG